MRIAAATLFGFALVLPQAKPAPAPVAGTGRAAITGRVLDGTSKQPVAGAVVTLSTHPRGAMNAVVLRLATDAAGRFAFTRLPAAPAYYLHAVQFGYFDGGYGMETPAAYEGRSIALDAGEWFREADVTLWRAASLTGRVTDENGDPVVGAFVRVLPRVLVSGVPRVAAGPITQTDDRGVYRIGGLAAGKYLVSFPSVQSSVPADAPPLQVANMFPAAYEANERAGMVTPFPNLVSVETANRLLVGTYVSPLPSKDGRARAYPPLFYPSARSLAEAGIVDLHYGEERGGVDLRLSPEPAVRVAGRVVGPAESLAGLTLRLVPRGSEELGVGSEAATALVAANGSFTMLNVPAGEYTLLSGRSVMQYHFAPGGSNLQTDLPEPPGFRGGQSNGRIPGATPGVGYSASTSTGDNTRVGWMAVAVAAPEVKDLVLEMKPGVTLRGRIDWEGAIQAPQVTVAGGGPAGSPRPGTTPIAAEPADGNPQLGMPPGRYDLATRTFEIPGLLSGAYKFRMLGGILIKSIVWEGRDVTYEPFDASQGHDFNGIVITMTDKAGVIEGTVRDENGNRVPLAAVLAFPTDRRQWSRFGYAPQNLQSAQTTSKGAYSLKLPAGEYYVVAVPVARAGDLYDPAFLAALAPRADIVKVEWDQTRTQVATLRTVR
jgi:protocatechuate 3,4-dioxygenase beta subunit